jgi:hypothetical protein
VLIAILPVLSVINISINAPQIFAIYCVVLPLTVYLLSRRALAKRPNAFPPPDVPIQTCSAKALSLVAVPIVVAIVCLMLPLGKEIPFLAMLWAPTLVLALYLHLTSFKAFERRCKLERMEKEFPDALVQLGNRIGEGRPAEDAFEHVAETTQGSELSQVFTRASANIRLGGLGLRAALFDPEHGALRGVDSKTIRSTFRMLVDIIERSTRAAGAVTLKIADHLRGLKQVELEIKRSLGEIVNSMRSVALFFAPLIAAITARMQGVLASKNAASFLGSGSTIQPTTFLFVLGIYATLLAAILTLYATEIEFGDDPLAKRVALARALPIALVVFTLGAIVGEQLLTTIIG